MTRALHIKTCDDCPNRDHSGGFTTGGAIPLCGATTTSRANQTKHPNYAGTMARLPYKTGENSRGMAFRAYTGEIPGWCPLPRL